MNCRVERYNGSGKISRTPLQLPLVTPIEAWRRGLVQIFIYGLQESSISHTSILFQRTSLFQQCFLF